MLRIAVLLAAVVAPLGAALAQDRPPLAPTRDVAVTYKARAPGQGQPREQTLRMMYSAAGRLLRIEGMGGPGGRGAGAYMIVDQAAQRMTMVMPHDRRFMEMPATPTFGRGFLLSDDMRFVRRGRETVAGLTCTIWESTDAKDGGTACVTDDGVLLRGRGRDGRDGLEATQVSYAPQPPALFKPPLDFEKMEMPQGGLPSGQPPQGQAPGR